MVHLIGLLAASLLMLTPLSESACAARLVGLNAGEVTEDPQSAFVPTELICPVDPGDGDLLFTSANARGEVFRSVFTFEHNVVTRLVVSRTTATGENVPIMDVRRGKLDPAALGKLEQSAQMVDGVKTRVCEGDPAYKAEYLAKLRQNRERPLGPGPR